MRPGRALSALAAPTSVVDALFQKSNGQQEDTTGMPAGKRSRGGDDDDGDVNHVAIYHLFEAIMCMQRLRELNEALPPCDNPDMPDRNCFRSLAGTSSDEASFRSLGTSSPFETPAATGSLGPVMEARANYEHYKARAPMVNAESKRVMDLLASALESLRQHFRPDQLMDPIFRPYDLEREFAAYQQAAALDEEMARLGVAQQDSPSSTMDRNPAAGSSV